jgi:hypothetical protein
MRVANPQQVSNLPHIVTGNIRDFPASWRDTRIVTARCFLEIMSGEIEETLV